MSDGIAVSRLFSQLSREQPPQHVRGIVHCAGALSDGSLRTQNADKLGMAWSGKVAGHCTCTRPPGWRRGPWTSSSSTARRRRFSGPPPRPRTRVPTPRPMPSLFSPAAVGAAPAGHKLAVGTWTAWALRPTPLTTPSPGPAFPPSRLPRATASSRCCSITSTPCRPCWRACPWTSDPGQQWARLPDARQHVVLRGSHAAALQYCYCCFPAASASIATETVQRYQSLRGAATRGRHAGGAAAGHAVEVTGGRSIIMMVMMAIASAWMTTCCSRRHVTEGIRVLGILTDALGLRIKVRERQRRRRRKQGHRSRSKRTCFESTMDIVLATRVSRHMRAAAVLAVYMACGFLLLTPRMHLSVHCANLLPPTADQAAGAPHAAQSLALPAHRA